MITSAAIGADTTSIVITIENHHFSPTEVHVPSNQKVIIQVKNLDDTAEEFECGALRIEKVIAAHSEGVIRLKPTEHGHYTFVGEYHEKTTRGVLVVD